MTQETNGALLPFGGQYLVSVYVKFLESAGARVTPILYPNVNEEITNFGMEQCRETL